ncbi:MAG TPA: hypothetical protein VJP02_06735 [Candidatus Sulfotelmatobacter sp.]|nr:hypothetical protein [Candidatus Sulfotelmatobacter sp.]
MSQVYAIPLQQVQLQKHRVIAGVITMFMTVPLATALVVFHFSGGRQSISAREMVRPMVVLTIAGAALWLHTSTLESFRIQLDGDRITQTQNRPFGMPPSKISFTRQDIAYIREFRKDGLMIHGRGSKGTYIDMYIPRTLEDYDDLRSRLAAWHPIRDSWL